MTLKEVIISFMKKQKGGVSTLKEIYNAVDDAIECGDYHTESDTVHDSARAIIYRHEEAFKRVVKGVYMLKGEHSTSLLIEGDGRVLSEIEDGSIDGAIITDHPWSDKKAHKSGNQKGFAEYETFKYTLEDFKQKYRVLKDGCFLVEFLPVMSSTNWEYIEEIMHMAKEAGFQFYTQCIWRNAPEGTVNTGKTCKGVQQLLIFSKGKPRKLSRPGVNAYQTRSILNYEIEMLLKNKEKHHQAEKPIALYEYLIEQLTDENEVCLDQFAGSCNMLQAAVNKNRFAVCYELCHDFVLKAKERFKCTTLYMPEFTDNLGNSIYLKCLELAKTGWDGNMEKIKKAMPWITDEHIKVCLNSKSFVDLIYANTGISLSPVLVA